MPKSFFETSSQMDCLPSSSVCSHLEPTQSWSLGSTLLWLSWSTPWTASSTGLPLPPVLGSFLSYQPSVSRVVFQSLHFAVGLSPRSSFSLLAVALQQSSLVPVAFSTAHAETSRSVSWTSALSPSFKHPAHSKSRMGGENPLLFLHPQLTPGSLFCK